MTFVWTLYQIATLIFPDIQSIVFSHTSGMAVGMAQHFSPG